MSVAGRRVALAYAVAGLLALAGLVVTALAEKPLAGQFFMFQFAAVVGAALYGGLGPGHFTMVVCCAGSFALFYSPKLERYEAYRLGAFMLVSMGFAWLAARMRDAKAEAEAARAKAEAAEAGARSIGALQERLVAVVSHDLRNPLNAIHVTAELLLRLDNSKRHANGLSRIVNCTRRMQAMIHDLLDYARAQSGSGLLVKPRPAKLGDICRAALDEVRAIEPNRAVLLHVPEDGRAMLDPARAEQVVCNLVTNALKHGSADGPVRVSVTDDATGVRLEVTNQGSPIPAHMMPTLFDPFRSGDAPGSIGLGLFIVREIVRAHGGTISVQSGERETKFTVVFPRERAQIRAATVP
jgi:signal transduction histidine kinase